MGVRFRGWGEEQRKKSWISVFRDVVLDSEATGSQQDDSGKESPSKQAPRLPLPAWAECRGES